MASFELWSSDLFDRESEPRREGEYTSLPAALESLWRHVLQEGVQDDGQPTFTDFQLRTEAGRSISLPRDPSHNPELARLRAAARLDPRLFAALAALHAPRVEQPFDFGPLMHLT